jgi:hypothetical protein
MTLRFHGPSAFWIAVMAVAAGFARAQPPVESTATELILKPDQTLEEAAEKIYEDAKASDEIRRINKIPKGQQPPAGKTMRLPGPERTMALTALQVASLAIAQAKEEKAEAFASEKLLAAQNALQKAQAARLDADYSACQRLADEAWALARLARQESLSKQDKKNRFSVSVDEQGTTRVEVAEGDGVEVSAESRSSRVTEGQAVQVKSGFPPEKARLLLPPPDPILPYDGSNLVTPSIYFRWQVVNGASRYVLLITRDPEGIQPVRQLTTENTSYLFQSSLSNGTYFFFLRTVDAQGLVGRSSAPRRFNLLVSNQSGVTVEPAPSASKSKER